VHVIDEPGGKEVTDHCGASNVRDHGLPLVALKEQRRDLIMALRGSVGQVQRTLSGRLLHQTAIAAMEAVISDLDDATSPLRFIRAIASVQLKASARRGKLMMLLRPRRQDQVLIDQIPLLMSNMIAPSSRILSRSDWQASWFVMLVRFMISKIFIGFSRSAVTTFSRSFNIHHSFFHFFKESLDDLHNRHGRRFVRMCAWHRLMIALGITRSTAMQLLLTPWRRAPLSLRGFHGFKMYAA
jgi:hypothetical protein